MSRYDIEVESIEQDERLAHDEYRCPGAPLCGDCLDEQEENDRESTNIKTNR